MSVYNAKKFILKCRNDSSFRRQVYECKSKQEVLCAARKAGIDFSGLDVTRAFAELKTQAQDEDELDEMAELKMWYEMQTGGEEPDPLSICYACSVRSTCTNYTKLQSGKTPEEIRQESSAEKQTGSKK
ncbi:MAG: Nif11-like leader peptide family RiPP precursor [Treponema sp.]|nr:Nif11-like leader peptide family RiPP precursor [Treponema sp.]